MFNKHRTFFRQLFAAVFLSLTINVSAQITATDGLVGNTVGVTSDDNADGGYKSLWNEVYNHAKADLPRSQIQVLQHIKEKARAEHNYGQLLTAQLMEATLTVSISPDSLKAVVEQLRKEEQMANDTAIAAVYRTVLSRLLNVRRIEPDTAAMLAQKAVEKPEILAAKSALDWQPFLVRGSDGSIFNDDLLSVVGFATGNAKAVHEYYLGTDNRKAQLVSAYMMLGTERSSTKKITDDIRVLDSLMTCYADLPECGELAIRKLQLMSESSCTPRQQIVFIDEALQKWGDWKNAVALQKGSSIQFVFDAPRDGSAVIRTAMIPTQANDKGDIRYSVSIDGGEPVVYSLKEPYRSEQWKRNVLRQQALRQTSVQVAKGRHTLTVTALDDHIIMDQWMLDYKPSRQFYLFPVTEK